MSKFAVYFVVCLVSLTFGAVGDCDTFDEENCNPYYCILDAGAAAGTLVCKEDPCFSQPATTCASAGGNKCKRVTVDGEVFDGDFCIGEYNHFTDCRLTSAALDQEMADPGNFDEDDLPKMETYCRDKGCGGVLGFSDKTGNSFFVCDEPGGDGTMYPDDFDVNNCKYYQFIEKNNKCDWDLCLFEPVETCSSKVECETIQVAGESTCVQKGRTITKCAQSYGVDVTSAQCQASGCGELGFVRSLKKNTYFYCNEKVDPPTCPICPSSASSLRMSAVAVLLVTAIFAFFF